MKQIVFVALAATCLLFSSCSKKSNVATPIATNVIEYTFTASTSAKYVMNYYDAISLGTAQNITTSTWSQKVTIPTGTKTADIFFTAGQNPPYTSTNTGTVTIKLNGKVVATGSKLFTSTSTLAEAHYAYIGD